MIWLYDYILISYALNPWNVGIHSDSWQVRIPHLPRYLPTNVCTFRRFQLHSPRSVCSTEAKDQATAGIELPGFITSRRLIDITDIPFLKKTFWTANQTVVYSFVLCCFAKWLQTWNAPGHQPQARTTHQAVVGCRHQNLQRGLILASSGNGEIWRCYQRSTQTAFNFCPARSSKRVFAPASNLKQMKVCLQIFAVNTVVRASMLAPTLQASLLPSQEDRHPKRFKKGTLMYLT